MNNKIIEFIEQQEKEIVDITDCKILYNHLYNLLILKHNNSCEYLTYNQTKLFVDSYIEYLEDANFGYDVFGYNKFIKIIEYLTFEEQISIINYTISKISKEFLEIDKKWFIKLKHKIEIKIILSKRDYKKYFRMLHLFIGQSLTRISIFVLLYYVMTSIILLSVNFNTIILFKVKYDNFSENYIINHLLNVAAFFVGIESNMEIIPINAGGVFVYLIGKLVFILLIINFLNVKITDKLENK